MKKKLFTVLSLLVICLVLAAPGTAIADSGFRTVEFDLHGLVDYNFPGGGSMPAEWAVSTTGTIKVRNNNVFLSPQKGQITLFGFDTNIVVTPLKQSEPVIYVLDETADYKYETWLTPITINIAGDMFTGTLMWYSYTAGETNWSGSEVDIIGIENGALIKGHGEGEYPVFR